MLKLALQILMIPVSVYLIGQSIRKNPTVDTLLASIEGGYQQFNSRLKQTSVLATLSRLQRLLWWTAGVSAFSTILVKQLFGEKSIVSLIGSIVFLVAIAGALSIQWCTRHRTLVGGRAKVVGALLFILSPMLLALFDATHGTSIVQILLLPVERGISTYHITLEPSASPFIRGALLSVCLGAGLVIQYIFMWIIATFFLFSFLIVLATSIQFARVIDWLYPSCNFLGFTVVLYIVIQAWLIFV